MSASHEFQIHERVNELLKLLGIEKAKELAPAISEYLEVNKIPSNSATIPIHQSLSKITANCPNAAEFTQKYNDLKTKNNRDVDVLVCFLADIIDKPEVKQLLASKSSMSNMSTIAGDNTFNLGSSSTLGSNSSKLSSTVLAEMKEKVLKGGTSNIITLSPNILSSISKIALSDKTLTKSKKDSVLPNYPEYSNWIHDRPYLSWDFYPNPEKFESDCEVSKMSISQQEEIIVDDLLNCMTGIEGKFIKTPSLIDKHAERTFHIDRSLDPAMRELAKRIVPVCSNYSLIIRFVEEKSLFKWGLVNQAFCSGIRELLKNHFVFICQLENLQRKGTLSLQKLWYYVSPIMGFMEILASIIKVINKGDCCGSSVINILFDKIICHSGDPKVQELILYLAQTASKPYLSMLEDWIYKGRINDPYNEFMITEDKDITKEKLKDDFNEKFWDKKYSINRNNVPKFLEDYSEQILLTGKYLNAIYETGTFLVRKDLNSNELNAEADDDELNGKSNGNGMAGNSNKLKMMYKNSNKKLVVPNAQEINFTIKDEYYKLIIENAYNYSSEVLLNLLLKDHKLINRLRSLKHYFLLDQSDFMVHFMDISEEELAKNVNAIKINRLESLLEVSLRITSANADPYKDDLRVKLSSSDLKSLVMRIQNVDFQNEKNENEQLMGLDAFTLDYVIKWPLSLIINKKTLIKYQILFRHIFYLKYVERLLCNVWLCTKSGEICLGRSYKYYSMACALKQRMLNFVQNLLNYMTFEVIESNWNILEEKMTKVSNIDNVIKHHGQFLDSCLRDCIITNPNFLIIYKILSICTSFSSYVQGMTDNSKKKEESAKLDTKIDIKLAQEKRKLALQEISEDLNKIVNSEEFARTITNNDKLFSQSLLELLAKIINDMSNGLGETKIGNVLYRLDFNDHYRDQLEKLTQEQLKQN